MTLGRVIRGISPRFVLLELVDIALTNRQSLPFTGVVSEERLDKAFPEEVGLLLGDAGVGAGTDQFPVTAAPTGRVQPVTDMGAR